MASVRSPGFEGTVSCLWRNSIVLLVAAASAGACASAPGPSAGRPGVYRAAYPMSDMSDQLGRAFRSVKQVHVMVAYDVYFFAEEAAPTRGDLHRADLPARAVAVDTTSETRRATAVLVSRSAGSVVLVTAAHAVARPDTLVEYFGPGPVEPDDFDRRVRSLSVKRLQVNWVLGLPGVRSFDILAQDPDHDVALIGFRYTRTDDLDDARSMPVRTGDPAALEPGSFVYVLGYPGGYGMVSQSVATPLQGAADAFVVDGNWNPGVSGGAIFALRGDRDELEWVGMARAGAAERELRLVPPETSTRDHDLAVPYAGPVYLEETLRIQYGITLSIPMTAIRRLVNASRDRLTALGYVIPSL